MGHDWGARVAYSLAALIPERIRAIAALALAYQLQAQFSMPDFGQARAFWYQWLMYLDAGVEAIRGDLVGFPRIQWDTWSPPGWFGEDEVHGHRAQLRQPRLDRDHAECLPRPVPARRGPRSPVRRAPPPSHPGRIPVGPER